MPKLIVKEHINTDLNITEEYWIPCYKCFDSTYWDESENIYPNVDRKISSLVEGKLFGKNIRMPLCINHIDRLLSFLVNTSNIVDYEVYYTKFVKDK